VLALAIFDPNDPLCGLDDVDSLSLNSPAGLWNRLGEHLGEGL